MSRALLASSCLDSTDGTRRITTGRILTETAWAYRKRPAVFGETKGIREKLIILSSDCAY